MSSPTGSPQRCVLSPLHYILYTDDCRSRHDNGHILKLADDTALVSLLHDEENDVGPVVDYFVDCYDRAFLQLNVARIKDTLIDFSRKPLAPQSTSIKGQVVEVVETYR